MTMGYMFRVRLSSFVAGACVASVAGFTYLYKDYMLARQVISHQVKDHYESLEKRYEALNVRVSAVENSKNAETATPSE